MHARVTRFSGLPPERIETTLGMFRDELLPAIKELQGYRGVQVMVDMQGGRALAITYWETHDDLVASAKAVGQARDAVVSELDPERTPIVDNYEVLLTEQPTPV